MEATQTTQPETVTAFGDTYTVPAPISHDMGDGTTATITAVLQFPRWHYSITITNAKGRVISNPVGHLGERCDGSESGDDMATAFAGWLASR